MIQQTSKDPQPQQRRTRAAIILLVLVVVSKISTAAAAPPSLPDHAANRHQQEPVALRSSSGESLRGNTSVDNLEIQPGKQRRRLNDASVVSSSASPPPLPPPAVRILRFPSFLRPSSCYAAEPNSCGSINVVRVERWQKTERRSSSRT